MPTFTRVFLCLVFVICIASKARAQNAVAGLERVAIAHLSFEGRIPEGAQELFAQRLVQGLSAARFEVLRDSDVRQALSGPSLALATCQSAVCYPAMANTLAASYLITVHVAESNKTYTVVMEIINGRTGGVLASNRERCETCGAEEAGEKIGLAASALRERLEVVSRAPARFIIRSRPTGAFVAVDGRQAGATPLDTELPGGPHHVRLSLAGHEPTSRSVTVVSGVDEVLDLDLVAVPSKFPFRTAGWASLAGGVALFATGLLTLAFDNKEISCAANQKDVNGHCPWVRSTKWWAVPMIGMGAAGATLGGVFLYLTPRPGAASVGGVAVGISRTF